LEPDQTPSKTVSYGCTLYANIYQSLVEGEGAPNPSCSKYLISRQGVASWLNNCFETDQTPSSIASY
jgi:hypothetical protein